MRDNQKNQGVTSDERLIVGYPALSDRINVPERTLRTWVYQGKIPHIRTGWRTVLFQPSKVFAALEKFEIKAATARK